MTGRPNRPEIRSFFHEPTNTAAHLVWDPTTKEAAIVDSVLDYDAAAGRTETIFADHVDAAVLEAAFAATGAETLIVKPTVSGGASSTTAMGESTEAAQFKGGAPKLQAAE